MVSCFEPIKTLIDIARNGPLGNIAQLLHFAAQEKNTNCILYFVLPQVARVIMAVFNLHPGQSKTEHHSGHKIKANVQPFSKHLNMTSSSYMLDE
jgi:hypothetical protein